MLTKTKIVTYSHGLIVYPGNPTARRALATYCVDNLAEWEYVKKPPTWKAVRQIKRVFAAATRTRSEYRFHRNALEDVLKHLDRSGIVRSSIVFEELPVPTPVPVDLTMCTDKTPLDYQVGLIDFLSKRDMKIKVTNLQTGKGKAESINAMVKIPGGWKRMGDIQVGDPVIAYDGTTTQVTGVFPQGKKQLYRVTFADQRSVEVCAEHLWKVYYVNTTKKRRWRIVDTMEMLRLISMPNPRVYVPLCESEQNADIELPIPPYTLGVLLGDGSFTTNTISICNDDPEVLENVTRELPDHLELVDRNRCRHDLVNRDRSKENPILNALKAYGLQGLASHRKFVPEEYKHASTEQRLALLQGLLDTDGTVNTKNAGGSVSFCSTSLHLAADVQYLVRSLGGIATISEKKTTYTYNGEKCNGRVAYNVLIRFKTPSKLFRLERKRVRTNDENQYAKDLKLRVISIVPTKVEEAQCISIDHPERLYVTDDFIVTHNTFSALSAMSRIGVRTIIQLRGGYVNRWLEDLEGMFKFRPGELLVVRGSAALMSIINQAKAGEFSAKVVVITNKTLFGFFKEYEVNPEDNPYGCKPEELYGLLGIGLRIIDEVHEDYHFNFRADIYCNVESSIHLSATLETEDSFKRYLYDIALPPDNWYRGIDYDAYIRVIALQYNFRKAATAELIRTSERGSDMYSHGAYEKSIIERPELLQNYLEIIRDPIHQYYMDNWKAGEKCLVFCYLVEFVEIVRAYLQEHYPELRVMSYVAGTDDAVLKVADIIVSTIGSCGTAIDIPGLKTSLLTQSVRKLEANEQIKGRLRKPRPPFDFTPTFLYLYNAAIPKHVEYHEAKIEQFKGKVASHSVAHLPILL